MVLLKQYKRPLIIISVVTLSLILMIAFGYTIGILSENPDGLETTLNYSGAGEPVSPFAPLLGFIQNDFVIGIIGIALIVVITIGIFYLLGFIKNRKI